MKKLPQGSTGSRNLDKLKARHTAYVKVGMDSPLLKVEIPGESPLQSIVYDGRHYAHVAEHADGSWIYRPV